MVKTMIWMSNLPQIASACSCECAILEGIVPCGDCGGTTQKGYVEILEFKHFVEFFSFNKIGENHREKELVRKVTVVVALDLGCGNTKNSEYESK